MRGDVQFDVSTTALREMRDAKEEAMRAVASQLEDEAAQWRALQAQAQGVARVQRKRERSGGGDEARGCRGSRRGCAADAGERDGRRGFVPGAVAMSVEEAKRRLEMQAEGLNAMVEGTEALCVRAERAAAEAGVEHDYRGCRTCTRRPTS